MDVRLLMELISLSWISYSEQDDETEPKMISGVSCVLLTNSAERRKRGVARRSEWISYNE